MLIIPISHSKSKSPGEKKKETLYLKLQQNEIEKEEITLMGDIIVLINNIDLAVYLRYKSEIAKKKT